MKILGMCWYGRNRSRYIADLLATKGHETDYAGVKQDHGEVQGKIDWADIVVSVHPDVAAVLKSSYDLEDTKLIELDVEDRPEKVLPEGKPLDGEDWKMFQERHVYTKLAEEIHEKLDL